MPTMVHDRSADLFVVIHPNRPPADNEWLAYLRSWSGHDMSRMRTLVFTDGGGPSAAQRKLATEALGGKASLTAVVSSSPMVRGVVTALSWFNPKIKAFSPDEAHHAFEYLRIATSEEIARTWILVERLRAKLGEKDLRSVVRAAA
jgi:hypothetical protein